MIRASDSVVGEKSSTAEVHANQYGANIIHYLAATDDLDKLRDFAQPRLLMQDHAGNSPLHYASESSSYRVAEYIISLFPDAPFYNQSHLTPGHFAARIGDLPMLKILSRSPRVMESVSFTGWNPLHCAIQNEHFHCVEFLVKQFPNLMNDVTNDYVFSDYPGLKYLSPLDLAKFLRDSKIVKLLSDHNAPTSFNAAASSNNLPAVSFFALSPDSGFRDLLTTPEASVALEFAASFGNYQICHFLLERGCRSDSWQSLLRIAVLSRSVPTVTVVACRCSTEEVADACFFAADGRFDEVVVALLGCISDSDVDTIVRNGDTLFLRFIKRQLLGVAEKVLNRGSIDFTRKDSRGANALHYGAASGATALVRALKSSGTLNERDNFGRIPLHYAIFAGHTDTIRYLVLARSDVNIADNFGITPLVAALALGEKYILPSEIAGARTYTLDFEGMLANLQPVVEQIEYFDYRTKTTKFFAHESPFVLKGEVLDLLQHNQMQPAGLKGLRLLHVAIVMTPFSDRLEECFEKNGRIQDDVDELGRAPIHIAALLTRTQQLKLLMRKNAALGIVDHAGNSIFHYIRHDSLVDFIQPIFEVFPALLTTPNNSGEYPIHVVAAAGAHRALMKYCQLSPDGSLLTALAPSGKTPVELALESGSEECVKYLFSLGVKNALVAALRRGDVLEANRLIATGFPINSATKNGKTPLHAAATLGDIQFVSFLIEKSADVNAVTATGLRPIHYAAQIGNIPICHALIHAGFDLASLSEKEQPCRLSSDPKCKKFLFDYWKREHYLKTLDSFFRSRQILLTTYLSTAADAKSVFSGVATFDALVDSIRQLLFVSARIEYHICKTTKKDVRADFSCHHLLQLLESMRVESYAFALADEFSSLCRISAGQDKQLIFFFLVPIYWVMSVYRIFERLQQHLVAQIDDATAYESLFRTCKARMAVVNKKMERLREILFSKMKGSFTIPAESKSLGDLYLYCQGRIDHVRSVARIAFSSQYFVAIKEFFGNEFAMPQAIEVKNRSLVTVALFSDYLCLFLPEIDQFVVFPLAVVNIISLKDSSGASDFQVACPLGHFVLKFSPSPSNSTYINLFADLFQTRLQELYPYYWGESDCGRPRDFLFQCMVVYQVRGKKSVRMRSMMVRAARKPECLDICAAHLAEVLSVEPDLMRVAVKEVKELQIPIISI